MKALPIGHRHGGTPGDGRKIVARNIEGFSALVQRPPRYEVNLAAYTIKETQRYIGSVYSATGAQILTLPELTKYNLGAEAVLVIIADEAGNAGANNITINPGGTDTINGGGGITISANYGVRVLLGTGTNWIIIV